MQLDMFDETLAKKILRLEKWINRLQKEMFFLKEVYHMSEREKRGFSPLKKMEQKDMFGT